MTVIQGSWEYCISRDPAATQASVLISAVPGSIMSRNAYPAPPSQASYIPPPAPCPPYLPLPMSPYFNPSIPSPQPCPVSQTLFPINLRATRPVALLSSYQLELLSDFIPARTKVRVENCSAQALLDVYLSEEALTTAEFTTFLNHLTLSAVPHSMLRRGPYPPRPRGCAPTIADVLLLGHTILWTLHSDMHNVWTATVDVPRPPMY